MYQFLEELKRFCEAMFSQSFPLHSDKCLIRLHLEVFAFQYGRNKIIFEIFMNLFQETESENYF